MWWKCLKLRLSMTRSTNKLSSAKGCLNIKERGTGTKRFVVQSVNARKSAPKQSSPESTGALHALQCKLCLVERGFAPVFLMRELSKIASICAKKILLNDNLNKIESKLNEDEHCRANWARAPPLLEVATALVRCIEQQHRLAVPTSSINQRCRSAVPTKSNDQQYRPVVPAHHLQHPDQFAPSIFDVYFCLFWPAWAVWPISSPACIQQIKKEDRTQRAFWKETFWLPTSGWSFPSGR